MNLFTKKELRTATKQIWDCLDQQGGALITTNGKPDVLLVDVRDSDYQRFADLIERERFAQAIQNIQQSSAKAGLDKLTFEEIDAIIAETRQDMAHERQRVAL